MKKEPYMTTALSKYWERILGQLLINLIITIAYSFLDKACIIGLARVGHCHHLVAIWCNTDTKSSLDLFLLLPQLGITFYSLKDKWKLFWLNQPEIIVYRLSKCGNKYFLGVIRREKWRFMMQSSDVGYFYTTARTLILKPTCYFFISSCLLLFDRPKAKVGFTCRWVMRLALFNYYYWTIINSGMVKSGLWTSTPGKMDWLQRLECKLDG